MGIDSTFPIPTRNFPRHFLRLDKRGGERQAKVVSDSLYHRTSKF